MIISTDGGLRPGNPKWVPMQEWLTANHVDIDQVPCDAVIKIKDGTCLGVEVYSRDKDGHYLRADPTDPDSMVARRIEWHPLTTQPPEILLI